MNVQAVIDDLEGHERALGARLIEAGKLDRAGLERVSPSLDRPATPRTATSWQA